MPDTPRDRKGDTRATRSRDTDLLPVAGGDHLFAQVLDFPCVTKCFEHLDHLRLPACGFDFLLRRLGESGSLYGQLLGNFAVAKQF